jgi:hypothetical protein
MDQAMRKKALFLATVGNVDSCVQESRVRSDAQLLAEWPYGKRTFAMHPPASRKRLAGPVPGVCDATERKVKMNAGVLKKILSTVLLLSILPGLDQITLAQTIDPPLVSIVASDHHAAEAEQESGAFTVSRSGTTENSLLVFFELSGTARNGVDYLELPRSITIPAGSASASITIKPINDSLVEGTETVVVTLVPSPTLSPVESYRIGFPNSDVLLLADNDSPPTNPPPAVRVLHPTNNATFLAPATIVLVAHAEPISQVRSVEFFAGDRRIGLATFEETRCLVCPVWVLEWTNVLVGEYTLTAKVTDSLGATAWSSPVHITFKSPEVSPIVLVAKGSIWKSLDDGSDQGTAWREPAFIDSEWKSGPAQLGFGDGDEASVLRAGNEERRFVTYYFRRAFEVAEVETISALTLHLLRDDGAVVYLNGNAVFRSNMPDGAITFNTLALQAVGPDGENVFHSASVDPRLLVNGRNVVAVEVHQVSTESTDVSFDLELAASVTKALPVVSIEATDAEGGEINPVLAIPPNPVVFKVTRTGDTNKALKVSYRLSGSARNGVDYADLSSLVAIFQPGQRAAEIVLQPIDDALVEGTESVVATLIQPPLIDPAAGSYLVGWKSRAEAHILDNDEPPPNALPAVKITQPAGGSTFPAPTTINIVAEVRDPDGWVGVVEFFANERKIGEQSMVFIREPDPGQVQSFSFEWKEVPRGEYTLAARATDNRAGKGASDPVRVRVGEATPLIPIVTIYARDAFAHEGTNSSGEINTAAFVVRRTGETNTDLTVLLSVHGTAENGVDYDKLPNSVTIPAGHHTARIVVKPIRDEQKEPLETVLLVLEPDPSLGPVARYSVGEPSKAAATIADSDQPPPADVRTADGMFHLSLPGENGSGFRLECSTDLITWMPLGTNVVTDGAIHFVDPDADEHAHRFYRVVPETKVDLDD